MSRSPDPNPEALTRDLGKVWAIDETSFKWHASCRHTHPSADALQALMKENNVKPEDVKDVVACVYQAARDVLGPAERAETVHQV
jgi:2-methylcitrate dehydratase PrpD